MATDGRDRPGRDQIGAVEGHFEEFTLAVGERRRFGDFLLVEWSADYGDDAIYRTSAIAEIEDGEPCGSPTTGESRSILGVARGNDRPARHAG